MKTNGCAELRALHALTHPPLAKVISKTRFHSCFKHQLLTQTKMNTESRTKSTENERLRERHDWEDREKKGDRRQTDRQTDSQTDRQTETGRTIFYFIYESNGLSYQSDTFLFLHPARIKGGGGGRQTDRQTDRVGDRQRQRHTDRQGTKVERTIKQSNCRNKKIRPAASSRPLTLVQPRMTSICVSNSVKSKIPHGCLISSSSTYVG